MSGKYSMDQIRSFLSSNVNKNTVDTFMKLLNLGYDAYTSVMDLMYEYKISVLDIQNNVPVINDDTVQSYIKGYQIQFAAYQQNPDSSVDGLSYLLDTLGLKSAVQTGIQNAISAEILNIDDYVPKVSVGVVDEATTYADFPSFMSVFNANVLPKILSEFNCMMSLEDNFPVTDSAIAALFSGVSGSYMTMASTPVQVMLSDFGAKVYKQIFGNFFSPTSYFSNENVAFLLYRINKRLSKMEILKGMSASMLNANFPDDSIKSLVNSEAMAIEADNALPDDMYMSMVASRLDSLDFTKNLNPALTSLFYIDLIIKSYNQQKNSAMTDSSGMDMGGDTGIGAVLDIISGKVSDFKRLITYSYDLANTYLVTL